MTVSIQQSECNTIIINEWIIECVSRNINK